MKTAPKSKRWLDGYQYEQWPIERHIGWTVVSAGWIDTRLERRNVMYNARCRDLLPPGLPMTLKAIDDYGYAYVYNEADGLMKLPVEVLEPWTR